MAIAQVGSLGAAATGTTSAAPSFGQATTSGNLVVAWAVAGSPGPAMATGSGWTQVLLGATQGIWIKICGNSETAPTFSGTTFTAAALAEFSGAGLSDTGGTSTATSSPSTFTNSAVDKFGGELGIAVSFYLYSMAATKTTSHAYNNGASTQAAASWNNDSTSTATHFRFSYGITNTNAAASALTDTFTTTNMSTRGMCFATMLATQFVLPILVMAPQRSVLL